MAVCVVISQVLVLVLLGLLARGAKFPVPKTDMAKDARKYANVKMVGLAIVRLDNVVVDQGL